MSNTVIKVENLSKQYRLGEVGTGSMRDDFKRFRYRMMGKKDPYLTIGEKNNRNTKSNSDYVWALKDINFEVAQGEIVGIIGRNGAGKSTLLKILSRTTGPTTGLVKAKGRIASLLEVGTGFHGELTGRENIFLNGAIMGLRKHEISRRLDEIIDFAEVERYLDTPVKRYSSGMYVRLAFAVAAHLDPDILIVDEVLAVGDADFQKKCLGKLSQVSKVNGRTILFVSHNMAAVTSLCNNCILLQNGSLESFDSTSKIIHQYILADESQKGEILENEIKYVQKYEWALFKAIRTLGQNGIQSRFGINEVISIELEYEILRDNEMIYPSVHILDNLGNTILATFNAHSANTYKDPLFGVPLKKGIYKSVCTIPAFFLNDNTYLISCFLVPKFSSDFAMVIEVLSILIVETGEMRKEFAGPWIGLIRPKMHWNSFKLS